jgi:hypothetical protein
MLCKKGGSGPRMLQNETPCQMEMMLGLDNGQYFPSLAVVLVFASMLQEVLKSTSNYGLLRSRNENSFKFQIPNCRNIDYLLLKT